MTTELDVRQHLNVIFPLLAPPTGSAPAFRFGEVPGADGNPGVLPPIYIVVSLARRAGVPQNQNGRTNRSGWRITLRYVGRFSLEAEAAEAKITAALNEKQINVSGIDSTPISYESGTGVRPDDTRFSGVVQYTYAL